MNPVETYLKELRDIRASGGVPETSGYGALANLLNEVGGKLKPKVRCIINPQNAGAGIPDGGLLHGRTSSRRASGEPLPGQLPARGAIEVKPVGDDAGQVAASRAGAPLPREVPPGAGHDLPRVRARRLRRRRPGGERSRASRLAASEAEFWALAAHPGSDAAQAARRAPHRVPAARAAAPGADRRAARTSPGSSPPTRARPGPALEERDLPALGHHAQGASRRRSA